MTGVETHTTVATFTLQLLTLTKADETRKRVLANLPAMLEAAEEDLNDLLPEGYEVRIKEWNQ